VVEMAKKGNLLSNGDFERGTTEGWQIGEFGLAGDFRLGLETTNVYRGSYSGKLIAEKDNAEAYVSYDKFCSFEDYEAYLLIGYIKMITTDKSQLILYGLDDNGEYIGKYCIGYTSECAIWKRFAGILRGFGEVTNFKVGLYIFASYEGGWAYIDDFKLLPLKSIRSHRLVEEWEITDLIGTELRVLPIGVIGECRLESMLKVTSVSGSSPTLDVKFDVFYPPSYQIIERIQHSQFTDTGYERISVDLPDGSYIWIVYEVGGSNPSFDLRHQIRLIPRECGDLTQGGGAL